jgi:predicted GNAT family acetyltransferase
MKIFEYENIAAGWQRCEAILSVDPANNTLPLSGIQRIQTSGAKHDERIYAVENEGRVIGAAVRVDTKTLFVSSLDESSADALGRFLRKINVELSGVVGQRDVVQQFTLAYLRGTHRTPKVHVRLMLYRLSEAFQAAPNYGRARGSARLATIEDLSLCVEWQTAFENEVNAIKPLASVEERMKRMIHASRLMLWESAFGETVSLAGGTELPAQSARIGPVYTPPTHRGQGFAQAVTAAMTVHLRRDEPRTVFLFTDAANPSSNIAYQRVGYAHVSDHLHLKYEPQETTT